MVLLYVCKRYYATGALAANIFTFVSKKAPIDQKTSDVFKPLLSLILLMKIEWLNADVTAVGPRTREESTVF